MKYEGEGVGATAFDYPDGQHPYKMKSIYYGDQRVPHPTNEAAKRVDGARVMREVLEAK